MTKKLCDVKSASNITHSRYSSPNSPIKDRKTSVTYRNSRNQAIRKKICMHAGWRAQRSALSLRPPRGPGKNERLRLQRRRGGRNEAVGGEGGRRVRGWAVETVQHMTLGLTRQFQFRKSTKKSRGKHTRVQDRTYGIALRKGFASLRARTKRRLAARQMEGLQSEAYKQDLGAHAPNHPRGIRWMAHDAIYSCTVASVTYRNRSINRNRNTEN